MDDMLQCLYLLAVTVLREGPEVKSPPNDARRPLSTRLQTHTHIQRNRQTYIMHDMCLFTLPLSPSCLLPLPFPFLSHRLCPFSLRCLLIGDGCLLNDLNRTMCVYITWLAISRRITIAHLIVKFSAIN